MFLAVIVNSKVAKQTEAPLREVDPCGTTSNRRVTRRVLLTLMTALLVFAASLTFSPASVVEAQPPTSDQACKAKGPTIRKARAAYRRDCSQPRVDCDPVNGAWICSSEQIGRAGPTTPARPPARPPAPPAPTPAPTPTSAPSDPDPTPARPGWIRVEDENARFNSAPVSARYNVSRHPVSSHRVRCESTHMAQVDPIVFPGRASAGHLHEFFGNSSVDENTTTQSLIDTPAADTTCTDKNDKSGYWTPVVYQNGRAVTATGFAAYFRTNPTGERTQPMPLGLRMIAGNAHGDGPDDQSGQWEGSTVSNRSGQMVRANSEGTIIRRTFFPDCWDGEHLDSPDHRSHVAYSDGNRCPRSHPVPIPMLRTWTFYCPLVRGTRLTRTSGTLSIPTRCRPLWIAARTTAGDVVPISARMGPYSKARSSDQVPHPVTPQIGWLGGDTPTHRLRSRPDATSLHTHSTVGPPPNSGRSPKKRPA